MDAWVEGTGTGVQARQCSDCIHFRKGREDFLPGSSSFTGYCTHPARQLESDPQPWVRERELACRLEWDRDLYEAREPGDDRVLDVRTFDPDAPDPDSNGRPRNVLQRLLILPVSIPVPAIRDERIGIALVPEGRSDPFDADGLLIELDPRMQADAGLPRVDLLRHLWRRRR